MKDYLKAFRESASAKKLPVDFFKDKKFKKSINKNKMIDSDKIKTIPPSDTITGTDLQSFAVETVLNFMNEDSQGEDQLSDEQKKEIEQKVREYASRSGLM